MRSPGVIYRRYRQIKKKIIYDRVACAGQRIFENCHYGKIVAYTDEAGTDQSIKVCNYNSLIDQGHIEICTCPKGCNAYVNKWTKDKILHEVDKELEDHNIKKNLYPELVLLEWVLDKDLNEATKNPGVLGAFIIKCIAFLEGILRKL